MTNLISLLLLLCALSAKAAPMIVAVQTVDHCGGPPPFTCPGLDIASTHAAGRVLTLEISRDNGVTWEFTGSSAGVADQDQVSKLSYQFLFWSDDVPMLLFRTVEY
jgi:hypothetical protein